MSGAGWILALMASVAVATPPPSETVRVERAMVDADPAPTSQSASGGYARLTSVGRDDVLLSARCDCAGTVDLHRIIREPKPDMVGAQTVPLAADVPFDIRPGTDWHFWIADLKRPLVAGEQVTMVLRFDIAGEIPVPFAIEAETKRAWAAFDQQ